MSLSFNGKGIESLHFNGKWASQIFFGAKLIWQKNVALLIMGNERYVCIEYIPTKNLISSSQNPINISVFMNTNKYDNTTPPMWILDSTGVTCGYSNTGTVGAQETIDGCTGYKRTNTFRDNQLFLIGGKTYYIIYKIWEYDTDNNYFAYYEDLDGHYKTWNINGGHTTVHDLTNKTDIGDISSFVDVIEASNNDLFIWNGITKSGLTSGYEYYRNNDSLNNYVPELNYGNADKYEVLNHILMMDKGSGQYGSAGNKFVITESYTDGPIGVISRTSNYTNHVWIPPSSSFFNRNADAYKYIFDPNVHLSDNDSQGKALVWGNNYIYTYGACYSRGSQYLGYTCYESRTGSYIDSPGDLANVQNNELFYLEQNVASAFNTSSGLKLRGSTTFDTVCTIADGNDFYAAFRTVAAATDAATNSGKALATVIQNSNYQWYNAIYEKKSGWQNMIGSSAITTEPSNPSTGDVYWKGQTTDTTIWINQYGQSLTEECLVKWGGSSWIKVETHQEQDYFTTTAASSLFSDANANGILTEFQPSQLYQEENISTLVTRVEGDTNLVDATLLTGKRHYLEVTEVNGV